MELLIDGFKNKEKICGPVESPAALCDWQGVALDRSDKVTRISWNWLHLSGTFNIQWIPLAVTDLSLTNNCRISRGISLAELPEALQELNLARNSFSGEIDLTGLPKSLKKLFLNVNTFTGTVCLTQLPHALTTMYLSGNLFFGSVDLTKLPSNMKALRLNKNGFSGEVDFRHLPQSLTEIHLQDTSLSGEYFRV
eukprot:CAMPEP_0201531472 /NCGR_PEP_ID=MMETSP0161_2-20130828/47716_1 /ASSEMBLY_ACC=CAM_ASM_000251 /TAXON_ID=180227 /ORGANISM="Neoparamoeba aestuarina, Strain SoJaBio B1-5/56/2" /LENGTH=194 /DNA_ID=CAMNT_0047934399 /DNA_START=12 /DNA_END=593 /DNA_ORIENTATION=+